MTPQNALSMPPGAESPAPPDLNAAAAQMGAGQMGPSPQAQAQQAEMQGQLNQLRQLDEQVRAMAQIPAIGEKMGQISKLVRDAMKDLVSRSQPVEQPAPRILG